MVTTARAPLRATPTPARRHALLQRRDVPRTRFRWTVDPWPAREVGSWTLHVHEHAGPFAGAVEDPGTESLRDLARELHDVPPDEPVAIGFATDPYLPDEAEFGRTRRVIEGLLDLEGLDVTITTKSTLVARDRDLLARLADRHRLAVNVAVPTLDRRLARALEPDAPRPDLRLKALSELAGAGVPVGILAAPVLPSIGDDAGAMDRLAAAAAGAGAEWLAANALVLLPSVQAALFPYLAIELPDLVDRARARHERSPVSPEAYRAGLADLVRRLSRAHGLTGDRAAAPGASERRGPQLALF
ncbi:MAG TPA: radical SAM protein [Gemmatimonadota bacterium]|nr:radical SAM protein [Gemmatimonadota bacterium]